MHASVVARFAPLERLRQRAWRQRRTALVAAVVAVLAVTSQGASAVSPTGTMAPDGGPSAAAIAAREQAALEQRAAGLSATYGANTTALADAGRAALASGRNEATIAAMLRLRWVGRASAGLERYAGGLNSADTSRLALAVAGVTHYSELINKALMSNGPDHLITVSLHDQRLVAYDHGRVVVDTLVTTGRATLPTDVGAMQVLGKDSPWTMHSPWPKGSPQWYPDTPVQMVLWFTNNGEGLHDASWQPAGTYGPGSTDGPYASHGCIHVPLAAETTLFQWAAIGTPVVVYPGDGTTLSSQMSQQSVDAMGNPIGGVRGA